MIRRGRLEDPPAPTRPRAGLGAIVFLAGLGALAAAEAPPLRPGAAATASAVAEARAALDRGDAETARAAIARALAVSPDDAEARRLATLAGVPLPPDPTAARSARDAAAQADLAAACDDARFLIAAGRSEEAIARLEQALALAGDSARDRDSATSLLAQARASATGAGAAAAADQRRAAVASARDRVEAQQHAAASIRAERLARIADLRQRGHLELALAHCRRLMTDLPADAEVESLFRDLLASVHDQRRASLAERETELRQEVAASVERSLLPTGFDGLPVYPADWDQRHSQVNLLEAPQAVPPWKAAILDRLAQRVSIQLDSAPIADALAMVSRLGGVNVVVSPELQASDRTVTLHANGMQLADVLSWSAEQAATQWSVDKGAVFVGTRADGERTTSLHDVASLLMGVPDFVGPSFDLGANSAAGGGGALTVQTAEVKSTVTADDISELIKRSISPRTWTTEGNAIAVRGTALWVTAPEDVQRLIREFLRAQSEQHALAVHIEDRWLELNDTLVEEIGVEWRSKSSDLLDAGGKGYLRQVNGWSFMGDSTNDLPSSTVNIANGAAATGLTLQAALVGASRMSAVLSATENNSQGRVLQSDELACLNGQRAYTFLGKQLAYIADYQIVSSNYDPTIKVLNLGSVLDVRPLVSADRRYVTMDLRVTNSSASLFTEYIGSVFLITSGNGTVVIPGASYPLELPNLRVEQAQTTVMVPDRGSLLIGGFRSAVDQFSASRVPLLGSIPFLGRLFGARGRYAQRTQRYLLSTVTILNYPELEARL